MENLAQHLLDFRKKLNVSQAKMGDLLGIPQRTWANYELGRSNPKVGVLIELEKMGFDYKKPVGAAEQIEISMQKARENLKNQLSADVLPVEYTLFRYNKPVPHSVPVNETNDPSTMVMLPFYNQKASAGPGEEATQLGEIHSFMPIAMELLKGANPASCGIIQVKGDSMIDIGLYTGDYVIFNTQDIDGDGIYVITINGVTRIKRLENRLIDKKIIISSENAKRYPNPEVLTYEQANEILTIHGRVVGWMHRYSY